LISGHYIQPRPLAILTHYGGGCITENYFQDHFPEYFAGLPAVDMDRIRPFLDELVTTGTTDPADAFEPDRLLCDMSPNPVWVRPSLDPDVAPPIKRVELVPWMIRENIWPQKLASVQVLLDDARWKDYPVSISIHGDQDVDAPYDIGLRTSRAIGEFSALKVMFQGHGQFAALACEVLC
jgi:hypothetical protein